MQLRAIKAMENGSKSSPVTFSLLKICLYCTTARSIHIASSAISFISILFLAPALEPLTHTLYHMYLKLVPPRREHNSTPQEVLGVLCEISADNRGYGIPKPP